jgi:hypothetical protein
VGHPVTDVVQARVVDQAEQRLQLIVENGAGIPGGQGGSQGSISPSRPVLLGDVARDLSADDLTEIRRVLGPEGSGVWLLIGPRGQVSSVRGIRAHLTPDSATTRLRRGSVVDILHDTAGVIARPGVPPEKLQSVPPAWFAARRARYAQVAVEGRRFDELHGDGDVNRPFEIVGSFDDDELIRLVRFIRTSPANMGTGRSARIPAVRGDWPIVRVKREDDRILVRLRRDDHAWHEVTVEPDGSTWSVRSIGLILA